MMIDKARKLFLNILVTNSLALLLLSVWASVNGAKAIPIETIFEIFGANILIHLGLILTHKFESKYAILEYLLDISYVIIVLVSFSFIFYWHRTMQLWALIIMAIVIYIFDILVYIFRLKNDEKKLNELLQKRKIMKNNVT